MIGAAEQKAGTRGETATEASVTVALSVRVAWAPKAGNRDDEYEDAFWPERALTTTHAVVRCAIADGATESAFAGLWARQLVAAYAVPTPRGMSEWDEGWLHALEQAQVVWQTQVAARPLPWYAEEKARCGAFAALLGVTIAPVAAQVRPWQVWAVGDCALFHVRGDLLKCAFPAAESSFFMRNPFLISSLPVHNATLQEHVQVATGVLAPGDVLYLVTDALGHWFLRQCEVRATPWVEVDRALAQRRRGFSAWVAGQRGRGQMRNDDVSVVRIAWKV